MKLPVNLGHDDDGSTARNLAGAAEHVSLIFTGSNREKPDTPLPPSAQRAQQVPYVLDYGEQTG